MAVRTAAHLAHTGQLAEGRRALILARRDSAMRRSSLKAGRVNYCCSRQRGLGGHRGQRRCGREEGIVGRLGVRLGEGRIFERPLMEMCEFRDRGA